MSANGLPTASSIFAGLLSRGYDPVHAAALAGNIQQESGFDPANINAGENAHGLLQWRDPNNQPDRWSRLQDFARSRGTDPTDVNTQLDFIGQEFAGPEKKAGNAFLTATDLPSANDALRGYIRYGDDSGATRLGYANGILNAGAPDGTPAPTSSSPGSVGLLNDAAPPAAAPIAPTPAPTATSNQNNNGQGYAALFNQAAQLIAPKTQAPPPLQPIQYPRLGSAAGVDPARLLAAMRGSALNG